MPIVRPTRALPCGPQPNSGWGSKGFCSIPSGFRIRGSERGEDYLLPGRESPACSGARCKSILANEPLDFVGLADVPLWR